MKLIVATISPERSQAVQVNDVVVPEVVDAIREAACDSDRLHASGSIFILPLIFVGDR